VFDTDILSGLLRPRPSDALIQRIGAVPSTDQFTTAISLGELIYGARRRGAADLERRIERLLASLSVLPFEERAAREFGPLKAELEQQGQPLAEADLRIAAIAIVAGFTLVSANVRHFSRVPGLYLGNWLT